MIRVFVTGATGFLGSHIVERLINEECYVIALKRKESNDWRCDEFKDKIEWIELDKDGNWQKQILDIKPSVFIHCAWIGVEANDRNNLTCQVKNIEFLAELLELAKQIKPDKFINLGSQAEYGILHEKTSETHITKPVTAYGYVKIASLAILKAFSEQNSINWIWLRLFSVLGERENDNWLIPSLIGTMKNSKEMNLTGGVQKYAYLYVKDFCEIIKRIVYSKVESGVYNVSSNNLFKLRQLIEKIRDKVNPTFKLNFGALPYRENQSMHIEGDMSKLEKQIGHFKLTDLDTALDKIIKLHG